MPPSALGGRTPYPAAERDLASPQRPVAPRRAPLRASIVIPVWNEEQNLEPLYARLAPVMDALAGGGPEPAVEAILVDDGSSDRSLEILRDLARRDPRIKVISFNRNYGQHAAVFAGLDAARGETTVTLDADLQNPPEDIPKLLARAEEGFDVVGGYREHRQDTAFRRIASRLTNRMMRRILSGVEFRDYGCMLRAYSRPVVDSMLLCEERSPFIPALACQFARRIAEVPVGHAERAAGESKYSLWKLIKLQADLITGFTSGPLRVATLAGTFISLLSIAFGVLLVLRRLFHGPEAQGLFTLFALLFLLVGGNFLALGILGEYVGRIYVEVRRRPRSVVAETVNLDYGERAGSGAAGSGAASAGVGSAGAAVKVLFFGYSQMGCRAVELLAERGDEIAAVVTHRDDPHENRWYRTPAEAAAERGLPIVYAEDLGRDGVVALAEETAADLILSVFYRDLLPDRALASARLAALNLHPSLLPAYRGRAPINWVLVNGERETGVTLHHMVARADAGDIVAQSRVAIAPRETALSLYLKIEAAGADLLRQALPQVAAGTAPRIAQDLARGSVVGRRRPEDGRIDWTWDAARIDRLVRAVAPPWPGAFAEIDGRRVAVHAGEPAEPLPAGVAPGTLRREGDALWVAAADRWFRLEEAEAEAEAEAKSAEAKSKPEDEVDESFQTAGRSASPAPGRN